MRPGLLAIAGLCLAACAGSGLPPAETPDADPSLARSPCMEVSLVGGLDTDVPGELTALFRCLNLSGGFDSAEPLVLALDSEQTRTGRTASLELAEVFNELAFDSDVLDLLRQATYLLQEHDVFLVHVVRTVAEWTYGRPWPEVAAAFEAGGGDLLTPAATEAGLVQPLIPVLSTLAQAILDLDRTGEVASFLGDLAAMPELVDALDTWAYLVAEQEAGVFDHLAEDWGRYFEAAVAADGQDTIVPLLESALVPRAALDGEAPLIAALEPLDTILDDPVIAERLVDVLGELYEAETLGPLTTQLRSLVAVDADGVPIVAGDDRESALEALLLLLDEAHQPVGCGLLEVDDLSVWILQTIAGWEPGTVETTIFLTEGLVDFLLTLGVVACDGVDPALVDHAPALVPLAQSGALHTLIPVLDALRLPMDSSHDRIPEAVDLLVVPARGQMLDGLAAHAREVLDEPGLGRALVVVGAYVAPGDTEVDGDIWTLLRIIDLLISPRTAAGPSSSPVGVLTEPLRRSVAEHDATLSQWLARWAVLLNSEGSESNTFAYHVAPLLDVDPELDLLSTAGRFVGDEELLGAMLRVLDCPGVASSLGASATPAQEPAFLGMIGRMSADGSLEAVLTLMTWVADTLDSVGLLATDEEQDDA